MHLVAVFRGGCGKGMGGSRGMVRCRGLNARKGHVRRTVHASGRRVDGFQFWAK